MKEADFLRVKEKCDSTRQARDRKEGALALLMEKLKKDFGCNDLMQGRALLDNLKTEHRKVENVLEEKWKEFQAAHPHLFEN